MAQMLAFILLLLSMSAVFGKYVYIQQKVLRSVALSYCKKNYTDLPPVSSEHDIQLLRNLVDPKYYNNDSYSFFWIGLERDSMNKNKWRWSGAGEVTKFFWEDGQPNNLFNDIYGVLRRDKWHDATMYNIFHFFCYNVIVVREKKTWLEALDYCKENHKDLASIASEAEMTLIWRELNKNYITDHVWIGLRFFPGDWLWTDGQPTDYQAWSKEGKPDCPEVGMECAALRKTRYACQSSNTVAVSGCAPEEVWVARDCNVKHYFVCY